MNKKVDELYKGIKDVYVLQCICSELKSQLQQKENIIKEVRKELKGWEKLDLDNLLVVIRNIEKILDKGE